MSARIDTHVADAIAEADDLEAQLVPDFADVIARAAKLRPPQDFDDLEHRVACARELDLLDDESLTRAARIGALDELVHSARETAAAQSTGAIPIVPPVRRRRVRPLVIGGALAACAAALVLFFGVRAQILAPGPERDYSGASQIATPQEWIASSERASPPPPAKPRVRAVIVPSPPIVEAPAPVVAPPRRKPARPSTNLATLDREARIAWQRGETMRAQTLLEELVRSGGRSTLADIAYGDLFELARQRKDAGREARLWKRYLEAFPRGRYADDARAGLCRRAAGEEAIACWRRYLAQHPDGTWREQAKRAIAATEPPP